MRRAIWITVIGMLVIFGALRWLGDSAGPEVAPGSTLVLEIAGSYIEAPEPSLMGRLLGQSARPFIGLLSQLAMAERDDRIGTVVLKIGNLDIGWAKVQELRGAIGRLRDAGRETVAYLEFFSLAAHREYFLASAADEIYVVPGGVVPLVGLAAEYLYLGGLWEKLGIEFQVVKAGRYKSAVEFYAGTGMSEASREMANALLDSTEQQFVEGVAESRGLSVDQVRSAFERGVIVTSDLIDLELVDGERHLDEITDSIDAPVIEGAEYVGVDLESLGFEAVAQYALVYGSGIVQQGDGEVGPGGAPIFAAEATANALEQAVEDEDIDAVILRIDSPGGSALASELIWRAIVKAKESSGKRVIASFSDVAASGGYYAASAADAIVSPGATLTGSIGVFALRPLVGGMLDKIGVRVESLTRGKRADFGLSSSPLSDGARKLLEVSVLDTYELFLRRVADGRSLERDEVHELAQGRVWTGQQAFERGLVDEIGGLHEAVARMNRERGIAPDADVLLVTYPPAKPLAEQIAELVNARLAAPLLGLVSARLGLPQPIVTLEGWLSALPASTPLLVPPALIEIR
jgi:protease-4